MQRFNSVPAKITVKDLQSHPADAVRKEANKVRANLPPKYFIQHNTKEVKVIEQETQKLLTQFKDTSEG